MFSEHDKDVLADECLSTVFTQCATRILTGMASV